MFPTTPRSCRGLARAAACTALWLALPAAPSLAAGAYDSNLLIYSTEGNRLRRYDVDTIGGALVEDVLIHAADDEPEHGGEGGTGGADPENGRDSNGVICAIPDGSGRFVLGEDTGQPGVPAGWGVFSADGVQEGKLTATYQTARDIGWSYFEKLAQQRIMQVQSAADPPKKLALGERAIMADGIEYGMFQLKESGKPVEIIYPSEGAPLIVGPNGVFKNAPNPNAARLLQSYMLSAECQQLSIEAGGMRSVHALTKEKPGRRPLSQIKTMKDDPAAVEKESEQIKARYTKIFKV